MDETTDFENSTASTSPRPRTQHISDVGMLDLRYAKTAEDIQDIKSISDVGIILISEGLKGGLGGIDVSDVGGIIPIPEGGKVSILSGQTKMTGDALASGEPDCSLIVLGQLFVTTPVKSVGYKEIRIHGQLFAARGSEAAIMSKLTQVSGQTFYIPENPRFLIGDSQFGQEYFELLNEPEALVVIGSLTFLSDVRKETLREKVTEIMLLGQINAPAHLIPLLEVITREKLGQIVASQ